MKIFLFIICVFSFSCACKKQCYEYHFVDKEESRYPSPDFEFTNYEKVLKEESFNRPLHKEDKK